MDQGEEIPFKQHNYIDWKKVLEKRKTGLYFFLENITCVVPAAEDQYCYYRKVPYLLKEISIALLHC